MVSQPLSSRGNSHGHLSRVSPWKLEQLPTTSGTRKQLVQQAWVDTRS